ncbi:hypothetical protein AVEN_238556-1, partial [Araneus ventricosus]
ENKNTLVHEEKYRLLLWMCFIIFPPPRRQHASPSSPLPRRQHASSSCRLFQRRQHSSLQRVEIRQLDEPVNEAWLMSPRRFLCRWLRSGMGRKLHGQHHY